MQSGHTSWVLLAHLLRPQGRKGELLADLLTDFPERFQQGSKVFVTPSGLETATPDAIPIEIASAWLPRGRNEGRIVIGFSGVTSIEDAERLAGSDVVIPEMERLELADGGVYVDDMVGCVVYDRDVPVGTVREVRFPTTADGRRRLAEAAPLLSVELASGEALIPFVTDFLVSLDVANKRISMVLPEGLLDLDSPPKPNAE